MSNKRGRVHEHKAPFHKQLCAQAFKVYSFVSLFVSNLRDVFSKAASTEPRGPYRDGSVVVPNE